MIGFGLIVLGFLGWFEDNQDNRMVFIAGIVLLIVDMIFN